MTITRRVLLFGMAAAPALARALRPLLAPPTSVPAGLRGTVIDANTVRVSWLGPRVVGYRVYRDNKLIAVTKQPEFLDSFPPDRAHKYHVIAEEL